jgi:hypothetical protein
MVTFIYLWSIDCWATGFGGLRCILRRLQLLFNMSFRLVSIFAAGAKLQMNKRSNYV